MENWYQGMQQQVILLLLHLTLFRPDKLGFVADSSFSHLRLAAVTNCRLFGVLDALQDIQGYQRKKMQPVMTYAALGFMGVFLPP